MRKLSLLERRANTIAILKALTEYLEDAILKNDKNTRKAVLYEYRKALRAAISEYNDFFFNLKHGANRRSESARRTLDSLVELEFLHYYDQHKTKNSLGDGKKATYANSLTALQKKSYELIKFIRRQSVYDNPSFGTQAPNYIPEIYLSGWSTSVDNGIIYAYGETSTGEKIEPDSTQMLDGTQISHHQFALVVTNTTGVPCNDYDDNLHHITSHAISMPEDDYSIALAELKKNRLLNTPNKEHHPLVIKLQKLIAHIESSHNKSPNNTSVIEELTIAIENTNQLLHMATTATPQELQTACANFQEKALKLEGAPSLELRKLSAFLVSVGVALLTLAILLPVNAPVALGVISVGLIGIGGAFFFNSLHRNISKKTSDFADELIAHPINTI